VLPLIVQGVSYGHDFEFHFRNWLEVSSQWKQGVLFPHWEFTAAWNSGEPRFIFYPPLSWTIGAALGLFLPWIAVPTTFVWLALTASGFSMHRLAREWTTSGNAVIAACFYMVHPYTLFNFYERSAYAELLAAAWIPLLLLGILRPRLTIAGIAVPICLLWLTNDPAAVIGCYSFALLALIRVVVSYRVGQGLRHCFKEAAKICAGTILGIGLAGFYIVPAAVERRWVDINMPFMRGVRYQDNFAFGYIGDLSHDAILRSVSLCGIALLVMSVVFVLISLLVGKGDEKSAPAEHHGVPIGGVLGALSLLSCAGVFMLTAPSSFVWSRLPELKYLQFPWRFCTILGATTATLSALAIRRIRLYPSVTAMTALALVIAFSLGGDHFFRQPYHWSFATPGILHDFYYGGRYDATDEYTPASADPLALARANPVFWIDANPTAAAAQTGAGYSTALAQRLHFNVSSDNPGFVILNLRDYPAWRISVNGSPIGIRPHRKDGLITVPIRSGNSEIDIEYAHTLDQTAGWIVSALSAILLLAIRWKRERAASFIA
jgi:hypothetical protein